LTAGDSSGAYRNKIMVNLEKCRWLSDVTSSQRLIVNIPSFELRLFEGDSCVMNMKAIVGRYDRKTPMISSYITSVTINPEWIVPPTILKEDMLPAIQKDQEYLKKNSLRLVDHDGMEIQPDSLPWMSYSGNNFPFTIKQDPGIRNALGLMKFRFANRHGIYMHDTNMHALFAHNERAFSSGCIRIERPFALATYLLKGTDWNEPDLQELVSTHKTTTISLPRQIQIQTTYFTLTLSPDGILQEAKDVYRWDPVIASCLSLPE
jgi:murein L,D-transpeptidase YcbB/YkuD